MSGIQNSDAGSRCRKRKTSRTGSSSTEKVRVPVTHIQYAEVNFKTFMALITGTVHSKCINDHTLRFDIFLPKYPTNVRQI